MAKMLVIYRTPADPVAFDRHYSGTHVPLAKKLPGLKKYELSEGPVTTPAGKTEIHLIAMLHFDDMAAIRLAFATPEGQAAAADRKILAPDPDDSQMYLFDSREV
jgi:uncharacterized protein (TIGR02118 family)